MKTETKSQVVGIGASAGGLDAFLELLKKLESDTGFVFVFIQHLMPDHSSMLPELLAKGTHMPVVTVKNNMATQPNHIYVIPPGKLISLKSEKFIVKKADPTLRMPIDYFFKHLAAEYGELSIGVVLSGSANDGTLGLREIKAVGGITFVQDELSAAFKGMPHSAVQDTEIDYILPPQQIAEELVRLSRVKLKGEKGSSEEQNEEYNKLKDKIFHLIRLRTGVDFFFYKSNTINRRIARRMLLTNVKDIREYYNLVKSNLGELESLYKDLLINVTNFFRDPETFESLKKTVYPSIFNNVNVETPIRIWVPACSTGEEVYSIAMTLLEYFGDNSRRTIQLFATDISDNAIEKARLGIYPPNIEQDVSLKRLKRFFKKVDGKYQINRSIRDMIIFAHHDVTKDPPFSKLDLISCRNLLIYLSPELQKKVIPLFHFALRPSGFLLLGNNETVGSFTELFSLEDKKNKIYARRESAIRLDYNLNINLPFTEKKMKKSPAAAEQDFQAEIDNLIYSKHSVSGFLVNEAMDILLFRGDTSDYITPTPGAASLNLFKLLNQDLLIEITTLLHLMKAEKQPVKKTGIPYNLNGVMKDLEIELIPISSPAEKKEQLTLIIFQSSKFKESESLPLQIQEDSKDKGIFQELKITKEYLQSIIEERESSNEELRSALEELQSSNEELQSINEEMETAKEELQSTNEELTTVNDELQSRNNELLQLNNDLINILSSVNIPIILLDNELRIRRYTPITEKIFNLIPSDVGRPITDLRSNIKIDNIEKSIDEVLETLSTKVLETQDDQDRWYSLYIRPYRTTENKIDGVILTLVDIDVLNKYNKEVEYSRNLSEAILDTARTPIVLLNEDTRIVKANKAFYNYFWIVPSDIEQKKLVELNHGMFNISELKNIIENSETEIPEYPLVIHGKFTKTGDSKLKLNIRRLISDSKKCNTVISFEEIAQ